MFIAISGLLARFLSAEGVERDDIVAVLKAQAAGNVQGMLDDQAGCRKRPPCVATTRANATRLRRSGAVKILTLTEEAAERAGEGVLRRWLRVSGRHGRPLDLLLQHDYGTFEDALEDLRERGFVVRAAGR